MKQIDVIAHVIQLSIAPAFLLSGVVSLLNVLSNRLARVIDRARILEAMLPALDEPAAKPVHHELRVLSRRGRLMYRSISFSTTSALLLCFVIGALFLSAMAHYSISLVVGALFVASMLTLTLGLLFFLREVFLAIGTFQVGLPEHA
ncbi:MAG TPA: DUF2721 domain-containing protein [Thermoanaerobaculia bacterium]|nr:DUF2721 domain-containing protein [Thermoanaerobaculia bacterium]